MPSIKERMEIRERGANIVRRHLGGLVRNPRRLVLKRILRKKYGEYSNPHWVLCLDGNEDNDVCYVGYGTKGILVSFEVWGPGKRTYRKYYTFEEAERDTEFKADLLRRVNKLIGEGDRE